MCFPLLAIAVSFSVPCALSATSFVSFLFSFLFAFVVVLVYLIPSLQSFFPGLFVLSAKRIIFHCNAPFRDCAILRDRPHKIWK
jgi:hypothetical protein